ncbi:hypothetical protein H359_0743 [Chlamydia ibidis 10-1398/6]|nr:hypothetical protein H359_0743 [Chlamydia ibidis 10-1398/6]
MESLAIREVARHAQILDMTPKPSALTTLMQTDKKTHWAFFSPPQNFHKQRCSNPYLAPSLGSPDQQDEDMEKISAYLRVLTRGKFSYRSRVTPLLSYRENKDKETEEEEEDSEETQLLKEGRILLKALDLGIKSSNVMIDYVISRIFQFVQG